METMNPLTVDGLPEPNNPRIEDRVLSGKTTFVRWQIFIASYYLTTLEKSAPRDYQEVRGSTSRS